MKKVWIVTIATLFLIVDLLTFHDFLEPHSLRDWLTLITSFMVFIYFAKELAQKRK